jgi:hypothetical protein
MKNVPLTIAVVGFVSLLNNAALAQSSTGQNWSSGWGFPSATDRSVALARANAMLTAKQQSKTIITYNNYYENDNRSNYVDVDTTGEVTTDFQIGDAIGENTYSVGSLNTGTTSIEVNGDSNDISASNSADNSGCVDGSIANTTLFTPSASDSLGFSGATTGTLGLGSVDIGNIASPIQECMN